MKTALQLLLFTEDQMHHKPRNQKEAVLYYLSKMDLDMVSLVLDEQRTYSDATKDVFIEKLKEVFVNFSSKGDTELRLIPGRCDDCHCHKGHTGYSFVGNQSNYRLNLIVEKQADEIVDMFYCSNFVLLTDENLESKESLDFYFNFDERADFNPPPQFWIDVQLGDKACEELIQSSGQYIDFEFIPYWLLQYETIFERIEAYRAATLQEKFFYCYMHVKVLHAMDVFSQKALDAMSEFNSRGLCKKRWKLLLKWLVENEDFYEKLYGLHIELEYLHADEQQPNLVRGIKSLYYDTRHFAIQNSFLRMFDRYINIIYPYYESLPAKHPIIKNEKDEDYTTTKTLKLLLEEKGIDY